MLTEPEGIPTDPDQDGGPVKTFLEHLEDLRWTLIKSISAIIIGMVICLVAGNKLVAFLTWPLERAQRLTPRTNDHVAVYLGTNLLGRIPITSIDTNLLTTNAPRAFDLIPVATPTNVLLTLRAHPPNPAGDNVNLVTLKNYSPIGSFIVALQLALYGGLTVSAPFVLYFVGQFVLPALRIHEKKFLFNTAGVGAFLFFLGVAFCYFIIMQVALFATVQFSQWMGFGADEWRAEDYIGFVCKFMLAMGLCFELPVVLLALVKIGLLDYKKLSAFRAYAVVIILFISGVVTPSGDPFTMVLMAMPIYGLYEISVLVARWWNYRDEKAAARADQLSA